MRKDPAGVCHGKDSKGIGGEIRPSCGAVPFQEIAEKEIAGEVVSVDYPLAEVMRRIPLGRSRVSPPR